ncbi:hypothetical protein [Streptomyces sp. NPDC007070]
MRPLADQRIVVDRSGCGRGGGGRLGGGRGGCWSGWTTGSGC